MNEIPYGLLINNCNKTLLNHLGNDFVLESGANARDMARAGETALHRRRFEIGDIPKRECRTAIAMLVRLGELQVLERHAKCCRDAALIQQYLDRNPDVIDQDRRDFSEFHRMLRDGETESAKRYFARKYCPNGLPERIADKQVRRAFADIAFAIDGLPEWTVMLLH